MARCIGAKPLVSLEPDREGPLIYLFFLVSAACDTGENAPREGADCFSPGACPIPSTLREGFWPWIPGVRPHHPQPLLPRGSRSSGLAQALLPSPCPVPGPPPGPLSTGDGAPSSAGCGRGTWTAASWVGRHPTGRSLLEEAAGSKGFFGRENGKEN